MHRIAKLTLWFRVLKNLIKRDIWIVEGSEISTGETLKIIFSGRVQNKSYITKLVFNSVCNESYLGKQYFWDLFFLIRKNRYKCSLAVIEGFFLDRYLYQARKDFFVPLWLEGIIDIPIMQINSSAKEDLRRIRKNQLEFTTTKDGDILYDFFYNWHLPIIKARHKEGTFESTYEFIMQKVKDGCGELLLVTKQGVPISGVFILTCDEIPQLWINGICDNKYLKEGAIAATYYFSSQYLEKYGYKKLSFANTRSFLKDGLLQYKKKWNITVKSADTRGFIMKPLETSNALKGFFINNPFTYIDKEKLYAAVFIEKDEPYSEKDFEQCHKSYFFKGFSGLNVFSFNETHSIKKYQHHPELYT